MEDKPERMLADFSVYNSCGVDAAKTLVNSGLFNDNLPQHYDIEYIFNRMSEIIEESN